MEELKWEVKTDINSFYDGIKSTIDYVCQSEMCRLEQARKNTEKVKEVYFKWIKLIESTQNQVMDAFKDFCKVESNLANKTKHELLKLHLKTILYITEEELKYDKWRKDIPLGIGAFIFCNWCLSKPQLDFVRLQLVEFELQKEILLCFDEVNVTLFFLIF